MDPISPNNVARKRSSRRSGKNEADGAAQPADGILAETPAAPAAPEAAPENAADIAAAPVHPDAPARPKKSRLVRGSYSMPEDEYRMLTGVKQACAAAGFKVKRADLLRIGVALIGKLQPAELQQVLAALPPRKPAKAGRKRASGA
jgi:hypothetical protein